MKNNMENINNNITAIKLLSKSQVLLGIVWHTPMQRDIPMCYKMLGCWCKYFTVIDIDIDRAQGLRRVLIFRDKKKASKLLMFS